LAYSTTENLWNWNVSKSCYAARCSVKWYYARDNDKKGPFEERQLKQLIATKVVLPDDLVWNESMGEQWLPLSDVPELMPADATANPFTGTGGQLPNADITRSARASLTGQWGLAIGGLLIYILVFMAASAIPLINMVAPLLIGGPLMVGLSIFFLAVSRRQQPAISQLFEGFSRFGSAFGAYILVSIFILLWAIPVVAVTGGLLIFYGVQASESAAPHFPAWIFLVMLLLEIPVFMAILRYSLTFFVLADHENCGPLEAIQNSARMMKGRKGKLFMLYLRFVGWSFLALFTFGIGFLFLSPYMFTSLARFYDDVATEGGEVVE